MRSAGVTFTVLGPVEVLTGSGERTAPPGRKPRALLASLLLHRGRPVSAGVLVDDLWGEEAPGGAETTLRSHVSALRKWLTGLDAGDLLTTDASGYRLAPAPGQVDIDQFEELTGTSQEALGLGQAERAEKAARDALALWRGQPFGDLPDAEQAGFEAARLDELRFAALEVRGAAQLQLGRHREALAELDALVAAHPFRERFCGQLMVALYRSGRQADALAAYARLRDGLVEELGLDPGPELQELSQQILRQDPQLAGDHRPAAAPIATPPSSGTDALPDALLDAAARAPMVGRHDEQQRLARTWELVGDHGRRVVLLSGDPGIGKTRLVAGVAAEAARAGRPVLVGRSEGTGLPYHPIAEALSSSAPVVRAISELPDGSRLPLEWLATPSGAEPGATPANQQTALVAAVVQLLNVLAASGPVLVVIEDAERLDRASALLLRQVADRLPSGVALVVCFRDPPGARHEPLGDLLGALARSDLVERITLAPLDEAATGALLAETAPGLTGEAVRDVWQRTAGNPFFTVELGRSLASGTAGRGTVPTGIRDALRQRLTELAPLTRQVLEGASVLNGPIDFGVLGKVLDLGDDDVAGALDDALDAGLLVESGRSWAGTYSFEHDLIRDTVRGELGGQRLRRLHARCAQVLASSTVPGGPGSSAVALHLRGAGSSAPTEETIDWCLHASREAESLAAWDEAIEHAEVAVDLLTAAGAGTRLAEVCIAVADLRFRSTRGFDHALLLLETALREYSAVGDQPRAAAVHSRIGSTLSLHHSVMDIPRALEHLDAADRLQAPTRNAFHVAHGRNQAAMFGMRTALLTESAAHASALADEAGRPDLAALADWAGAWAAFNAGEVATAFELLDRSWRTSHDLADPTLGWGSVNAAALMANAYLLDPARARTWCRRALGQPRFDALEYGHETAADQLVQALCAQGDLDAARQAATSLSESATARRMLAFLDGRWEDAATSWADAAAADESAGDLHDAVSNLRWLARARQVLGDRAGAGTALARALALCEAGPQVPSELAVRSELARLLAPEDPPGARRHLDAVEALLGDASRWGGLMGTVELARAAVRSAEGHHDEALADVRGALEVFTAHGLVWWTAEAQLTWSSVLAEGGDPDGAAAATTEAASTYARIGAVDRWRERITR